MIEVNQLTEPGLDAAELPPAPRFLLRMAGSFRVVDRDGAGDSTPSSRKAQAILAYLALAPDHCATRERLVGLLWSERGEEQARASLRQALAELRGLPIGLPEAMRIVRREVMLLPHAFETDVARIAGFVARGDLPALATEIEQMDGRFLDAFEGVDRGYDDWLFGERQRQRQRLVEGVYGLCARDDLPPALLPLRRSILTALQRIDSGDEAIVRKGMELDHAAGDVTAVHRRFRFFEGGLRRDYDATPSPETQRLYRRLTTIGEVTPVAVRPAADVVTSPAVISPPAGRVEPPIIVMARFAAIGAGEAATLAEICRDDIEIALGSISDLRILSLADPEPSALEAACATSIASYMLHGSVRAVGNEYRFNFRLVGIPNGVLVWSRQLSLRQAELGDALDDVVARIAGAVHPVVERDVGRAVHEARGGDRTGYGLYVRARAKLLTATSLAEVQEAAALFEQAIAADRGLTNAHLNLARLYNTDFEQRMAGHDPAPLRARAFELCAEAASLDPANAHAHSRLGWCYLRRGAGRQAQARFEEALQLSPHHADRLEEVGFGHVHLGALDEGQALIARAFELNPFPRDDYFSDMGVLLMLRGQRAQAEEQFEISRDTSLHYRAVRTANLALLEPDGRVEAMAAAIRADFARIWQGEGPAADGELVRAVCEFVPLQREEDRATLLRGLAAAGISG